MRNLFQTIPETTWFAPIKVPVCVASVCATTKPRTVCRSTESTANAMTIRVRKTAMVWLVVAKADVVITSATAWTAGPVSRASVLWTSQPVWVRSMAKSVMDTVCAAAAGASASELRRVKCHRKYGQVAFATSVLPVMKSVLSTTLAYSVTPSTLARTNHFARRTASLTCE